ARKAGLPQSVIDRAYELLNELQGSKTLPVLERVYRESMVQEEKQVLESILEIDIANITPLQALVKLAEIRERIYTLVKNGGV
ncbi:MAG: hypothetical protein NZ851_04100, partial [Aquificaceae bacterium]|nr:hypothetical protein [Aquificaceae bacterium]